jgi:deferrochelatase/peroxidase EfeB
VIAPVRPWKAWILRPLLRVLERFKPLQKGLIDLSMVQFAGGKEKLASKLVGRWRDGTPVKLPPERPDPEIAADRNRNSNFTFGNDLDGSRCPLSAHVRRTNPRDAFGFNGALANRRRISRRGMPYGPYAAEDAPVSDEEERGIVFMALNASLFRQFEFVQQRTRFWEITTAAGSS